MQPTLIDFTGLQLVQATRVQVSGNQTNQAKGKEREIKIEIDTEYRYKAEKLSKLISRSGFR